MTIDHINLKGYILNSRKLKRVRVFQRQKARMNLEGKNDNEHSFLALPVSEETIKFSI